MMFLCFPMIFIISISEIRSERSFSVASAVREDNKSLQADWSTSSQLQSYVHTVHLPHVQEPMVLTLDKHGVFFLFFLLFTSASQASSNLQLEQAWCAMSSGDSLESWSSFFFHSSTPIRLGDMGRPWCNGRVVGWKIASLIPALSAPYVEVYGFYGCKN